MLVKITKTFGSWYSGEERDLGDSFAQRLVDEGKAVRIENKRLKTLEEAVAQKAELETAIKTEELKAQTMREEKAEKAVALRKKKRVGEAKAKSSETDSGNTGEGL